jgi:sterol O-acyltransferase
MLRFADRQFYLDWWNSTSYNMYYRQWNILVQDWLYTYIYRDLYMVIHCLLINFVFCFVSNFNLKNWNWQLFGKKNKLFCQFGVIFISALFHEHILSFSFGFFYPILFVLFAGFGCKINFWFKFFNLFKLFKFLF